MLVSSDVILENTAPVQIWASNDFFTRLWGVFSLKKCYIYVCCVYSTLQTEKSVYRAGKMSFDAEINTADVLLDVKIDCEGKIKKSIFKKKIQLKSNLSTTRMHVYAKMRQ